MSQREEIIEVLIKMRLGRIHPAEQRQKYHKELNALSGHEIHKRCKAEAKTVSITSQSLLESHYQLISFKEFKKLIKSMREMKDTILSQSYREKYNTLIVEELQYTFDVLRAEAKQHPLEPKNQYIQKFLEDAADVLLGRIN